MNRPMIQRFAIRTMIVMTLVLTSCLGDKSGTYDHRLIAADSVLRQNDPDIALKLLESMDDSKLRDKGNRAYHALLLTQARYRCYVKITNDSLIDIALDYYQHHAGEREKLARAYLYKGAITEMLGNPTDAITYYRQTTDVALPNDHYNQGYAKMRIGSLYSDNLVADSSDIVLFKAALHHFEQVPDSFYIANCLSMIGRSYNANSNTDSAVMYLERAAALAHRIQEPKLEMRTLGSLADLKMFSPNPRDIDQAKRIALFLLQSDDNLPDRRDHLLLMAAYTLAKQNKADSANIYLVQVENRRLNNELTVFYHDCCAEVARCHGDFDQFKRHVDISHHLADSLVTNKLQQQLREVEAKYDNEALQKQTLHYRNRLLMSLLALAILCLMIVVMRHHLKSRRLELQRSQDTIEQLRDEAAQFMPRLIAQQAMSQELKETIGHQVEVYTRLVEKFASKKDKAQKDFDKAFVQSYSMSHLDESFWAGLRTYVNSQYNSIISESIATNPSLSETDINYLALYCCGVPTSVIMACMGYKEVHSAYNKKRRVAEALGYPNNLDGYVEHYKSRY